jgi:hypothetical protein
MFDQSAKEAVGGSLAKRPTTQERLELRKKELEEELRAVNRAIALFGEHPEISEALDLIQKTRL